jgi:hypothetical protein
MKISNFSKFIKNSSKLTSYSGAFAKTALDDSSVFHECSLSSSLSMFESSLISTVFSNGTFVSIIVFASINLESKLSLTTIYIVLVFEVEIDSITK